MIGAILGKDIGGVSDEEYLIILTTKDYDELTQKELDLLSIKELVREYLKFKSSDGNKIRKQLRDELKRVCE